MLNVLLNIIEFKSFGVSVVETMDFGIPVVVTNVGELKEVVKDDSVGLKVNVKDVNANISAIEQLINDKELYNQISLNARKHVIENYNWNDNLKQMITEYYKLLTK
jgi:glycosyltransferase involved in cell wall biosynthesis